MFLNFGYSTLPIMLPCPYEVLRIFCCIFVVYLLYVVLEKLLRIFIISHTFNLMMIQGWDFSQDLVSITVCLTLNIGQFLLYGHCKSCNSFRFLFILIIRKPRAVLFFFQLFLSYCNNNCYCLCSTTSRGLF